MGVCVGLSLSALTWKPVPGVKKTSAARAELALKKLAGGKVRCGEGVGDAVPVDLAPAVLERAGDVRVQGPRKSRKSPTAA